jgi:hypothetical protein
MEERTQLRNPARIRQKKERAHNNQDESTTHARLSTNSVDMLVHVRRFSAWVLARHRTHTFAASATLRSMGIRYRIYRGIDYGVILTDLPTDRAHI